MEASVGSNEESVSNHCLQVIWYGGWLIWQKRLVSESQAFVGHMTYCQCFVCVCVSLRASYVKFVVPDIWWSHLHSTLHKSAPKQLVFRFVSGIKGRKNMNYAHDGRELRRGVAFNSGTRLLCLEPKLRDECSVRWGQTCWDASV